MEKLITTKELAEKMNVTVQTIWRWREEGMPCERLSKRTIRYKFSEVLEWCKNKRY